MTVNHSVPAASTARWKDGKRYLWLIGLAVPSLAFIGYGMHALTGWGVWFWIGPIVILIVVPVIDLVAGLDRSNPPDDVIEALEKDRYYRWITYLFLPIQYTGFVGAFWLIATGDLGAADRVGLAISIGCIGGIGINTAHELGHKREGHERWLSKIAQAQSFYQFWPRTVLGSLRSAWNLERRRIARRRRHPFRIGNDVLNAWLMSAVLWGAMVLAFGAGILPYLVIQAVVGFSLLEVVNYMEHYGMCRQRTRGGTGRYERVDPSHSWNSNNIATNVLLYHLQRHSDHHANPTRRYQTLRDFQQSPALPTGYAGMIVLALVPPVWRRVMDPRVLAHFDGDLSRANLSPRGRDRLLAAYPPPTVETRVVSTGSSSGSSTDGVDGEVLAARCPGCGYTYEVASGEEREGFAAGTAWADVPDSWCCPDCGVREKVDFVPVTSELESAS